MNFQPSRPPRRFPVKGWVVVLPTLIILALALLLSETTNAAPSPAHPRAASNQLTFQEQQPLCQSCHPDEYNVWKSSTHAQATLDPVFQEQLAKSHNQGDCLKCHTTGFDTGSGKFMSEGVTCEACHGAYKEGHPAAQTMTLPMDAGTCRMCHEAAFSEWETSKHAEQKIECFDCHQAHTQGVRTGSAETLCAACHSDEQTKLTHSVHGISGVDCGSCHMAKEMTETASTTGMTLAASSHSFAVPADVCNRCHSSATHPTGSVQIKVSQTGSTTVAEAQPAVQSTARVNELESEVAALEAQADSLRNLAVLSMGLALGVGGFFGLLAGIVAMSLWHARTSAKAK